jgi:hypothetical protein
MVSRRNAPLLTSAIAALVLLAVVAVGWRMLNGDSSLLRDVTLGHDRITPDADGDQDATPFKYKLSRNATVSIFFTDQSDQHFYFRQERPRGAGEYEVLFSGIVNGYRLPDETVQGEILSRLLQDGDYTWTVSATDENDVTESVQGRLTIAEADTTLPEMRGFDLDKQVFTPNRDGISDRVLTQFQLMKEVAELRVFLLTPDGIELPISELEREIPARMPGRHYFDYEGGVDNGETPPPDGTYPVVAIAQDLEGQRIRVEDVLTIEYGGVPRADILAPPTGDQLQLDATAVALCGTIHFTLTVSNYGNTPIRTSGPVPGTVYDSNWNYNTLGWHTESGVWRVAIGYENELTNYPYRWAVGEPEDLEKIGDHYYLMPGERALITGGIRVVDVFGDRNPQPMWAGLIHEDVEISQFNTHVDPHEILVDVPDESNASACDERQIPMKESQ